MKKYFIVFLLFLLNISILAAENQCKIIVTENLRLRDDTSTSAKVICTIKAGSEVIIKKWNTLQNDASFGSKLIDKIDGIESTWVKIATEKGAVDKDGNLIETGTEGWVFGGYLVQEKTIDTRNKEYKIIQRFRYTSEIEHNFYFKYKNKEYFLGKLDFNSDRLYVSSDVIVKTDNGFLVSFFYAPDGKSFPTITHLVYYVDPDAGKVKFVCKSCEDQNEWWANCYYFNKDNAEYVIVYSGVESEISDKAVYKIEKDMTITVQDSSKFDELYSLLKENRKAFDYLF